MTSTRLALAWVACSLMSCAKKPAPAPVETPRFSEASLEVAVVVDEPADRSIKALADAFATATRRVQVEARPARDLYMLSEGVDEASRRLESADRERVKAASKIAAVTFHWPASELEGLRSAEKIIGQLIVQKHALVADPQQVSFFTETTWQRRLDDGWVDGLPSTPLHFMVHMVPQDDGLFMLDTGGLSRLGLQDLVVMDVSRAQASGVGLFINLLVQRLVEGAPIDTNGRVTVDIDEVKVEGLRGQIAGGLMKGAKKKITVRLVKSDGLNGKRPDPYVVTFPDVKCHEPGECIDQAMTAVFGSSDASVDIHADDPRVMAAQERARKALRSYEAKVTKGLPDRDVLLVKASFPCGANSTEWMWIDVRRFVKDELVGRLETQPDCATDFTPGATVTVSFDRVGDYMYKFTDGTFLGNEMGRVLVPERFVDAGAGRLRVVETEESFKAR